MIEYGVNWEAIGIVAGGLLAFGMAYNRLVAWLIAKGYDEGYMAFIVTGGVLAVIAGYAVVDGCGAVILLLLFAAAGLPMMMGSWWRHVQARRRAQEAVVHDAAQRMAEFEG
jgi:hypothetical protein